MRWLPMLCSAAFTLSGSLMHPAFSAAKPNAFFGLRKFPYPFHAMLAISSDADHETVRKFEMIHEFLNTKKDTPMGWGLNLDISDSVFMYNGSNINQPVDINGTPIQEEMSYFVGTSQTPKDAVLINAWIHKGWIDTLHSFGDFSRVNPNQTLFTRKLAKRALHALRIHHDYLTVWTDHGNRSNVDDMGSYGTTPFFSYQQGALPSSPYYQANLTIPYGVKFVWADTTSDVFGHSSMIYPLKLANGKTVWGFSRYTNSGYNVLGDPQYVWTEDDLPQELSPSLLHSLIVNHQYSIIAQHLEANNTILPLTSPSIHSLIYLARLQKKGLILVAGTARLLQYNVTNQFIHYHIIHQKKRMIINVTNLHDPVFGTSRPTVNDVRGLTFYVRKPDWTTIFLDGKPLPKSLIQRNRSDGKHPSIEIKWFPQ